MTVQEELSPLDKGTLAVWRSASILVPMAIAFGVAVMFTWFLNRLGPWYMTFGFSEHPGFTRWTLVLAVAIGVASGVILGRYAYRHAEVAAAGVAAIHVILCGHAAIGLGTRAAEVLVSPLWAISDASQAIIGAIQIAVAFGTAAFVRRRRPVALRGGRKVLEGLEG